MISFVQVLDFIGTFAFAISGIRLASAKRFDWFGAYIVGLATAIGGGTLRDVMLNVTPVWMTDPIYLICTAFAMFFVIIFGKYLIHLNNTFFFFDSIGLALFTKEIYAMACVIGGLFYWICLQIGLEAYISQIIGFITVLLVRILAVKYQITLPILKGDPANEK